MTILISSLDPICLPTSCLTKRSNNKRRCKNNRKCSIR